MDLQPYVDRVRHDMGVIAAAGGGDAVASADRLTAPLEATIRLTLMEALSAAAEEITRELAPGLVELRLRGQNPEFVVAAEGSVVADQRAVATPDSDDDGGTWRVTLRLPERMRIGVDGAARADGLSVNAWLVRAVESALANRTKSRSQAGSGKHLSGWVR